MGLKLHKELERESSYSEIKVFRSLHEGACA